MSDDIAIKVDGLSKCYQIYDQPRDRLKQFILPRLQRLVGQTPKQYFREFWALKDVSFEVKKGETAGIIGRNGSGKSTLLQMICGTLNPTSGSISAHGRIAALLELGSGFNPEFTGRENVYLNAAVLGLRKDEIDARFDDIVAFADIGGFIEQPIKTYSSGMMVRLAFAVIAHVDADILVIDEALAVGDAFFQQKCMRFLRSFQERQGTVLFVSHDTGSVLGLCNRALMLMPNTYGIDVGDAESICKLYLERLYADPLRQTSKAPDSRDVERRAVVRHVGRQVFGGVMNPETLYKVSMFRPSSETFGQGGASIVDAGFLDIDSQAISTFQGDQRIRFFIQVDVHRHIQWPAFGFMIKNSLGEYVFTEGTDVHFEHLELSLFQGDVATIVFEFTMPHLARGKYLINLAFAEGLGDEHIQHCWMHDAIQLDVLSSRLAHGYCGMNHITMSLQIDSARGV